jgi:phosphoribosyl-ATP pyrophosphohydrolase
VIIPSIDLSNGRTVQLIEGESVAIDAGDPIPILDRFSVVGEVAVIDIDAARGEGENRDLISKLCRRARIRVGGGIRDIETAVSWLDLGAEKVIIGTAASPQLLAALPRDRVIVALDSRDGKVVSHGWRHTTNHDVIERVEALRDLCGGFLVTFVEREGRLEGTDLERASAVVASAGDARVTVAGGVTTVDEVTELDRIGADAQVGMALYTGQIGLGSAVAGVMRSDRSDGLWPTVVVDDRGIALGLAFSNAESLSQAIDTGRGVYHSRSRGLWVKGETSGAVQELRAVDIDCDRDTLRFTVHQHKGFCHTGDRTCWGEDHGLSRLQRRLFDISSNGNATSNTRKLLDDPALLSAKILEEAAELANAAGSGSVVAEAADLLYFLLVKATAADVALDEIEDELDHRERRVTRRPMVSKEGQT